MIFIANTDGTLVEVVPSNINQGSVKVNEITIVAPLPATAALTMAFILPNGINTPPYLMTQSGFGIPAGNTTYRAWSAELDASITEFSGSVTVQFYATANGGTLATYADTFTVNAGVPVELPDMPTEDVYQQILEALATVQSDYENANERIAMAQSDILVLNRNVTQAQSDIEYLKDTVNTLGTVTIPAIADEVESLEADKLDKVTTQTSNATRTYVIYPDGSQGVLQYIYPNSIKLEKTGDLTYQLIVGEDANGIPRVGGTINIPKDQFLKDVEYNENSQELIFTFSTVDGTDREITVSIADLIDVNELNSAIAQLDGRLDTAEERLDAQATQITALQTAQANQAAQIQANLLGITDLRNLVNQQQTYINALSDKVDDLQDDLQQTDSTVAQNTSRINAAEQNIAANTAAVAQNTQNIATNTQNIATNTQNISDNTEAISAVQTDAEILRKRVTNLEQGIVPSPFSEDSSVAYVKTVPTNAAPFAAILKVGGMSYRVGDDVRHAAVTAVEITGANLFGGRALADALVSMSNATLDEAQKTVSFTGRNASGDVYFSGFKPNTQYTFIMKAKGVTTTGVGGSLSFVVSYSDGTSSLFSPASTGDTTIVVVSTSGKTVSSFIGSDRATTTLYYEECGIFEGVLTAEDFKPYFKNTFPIPESLQALDGYGWGVNGTYNNHFAYEDDARVTWNKPIVKKVIDGSEVWTANGTGESKYFRTEIGALGTIVDNIAVSNRYDQTAIAAGSTAIGLTAVNSAGFNVAQVSVRPEGVADMTVADFKAMLAEWYAAGNPLTVYCAVTTPVVTDITDLISPDNYVKVEGGGTLTFVNENALAPASTVEYLLKEATV